MARKKNRSHDPAPSIVVSAKNKEQKDLIKAILDNTITFVKGTPGTGKTYISVSVGLQLLEQGQVKQLLFSRPVVEAAGEKLGYLPGSIEEKVNPYMLPIFDTLMKHIPIDQMKKMMSNDIDSRIRVLPLAYMRGATFSDTYCVIDEAQNTNPDQMRMLLTRLGEGSKMVICGDVRQSDIADKDGLSDSFEILQGIDQVGFVTLTQHAVVRHPIITEIEQRYESRSES